MSPINCFYECTKDNATSPLLVQAVALLSSGSNALDLGRGSGRDTRFLIEHGFHVTAVDKDEDAFPYLAALSPEQIHCVHSTFVQFAFVPSTYCSKKSKATIIDGNACCKGARGDILKLSAKRRTGFQTYYTERDQPG